MERNIIIGKMIRYFLKRDNLTIKQLGTKLDKTESTVSKWINNKSTPMAKDLSKMTYIFNTDIYTLMYGEHDGENYDILNSINSTSSKLDTPRQQNVLTYAQTQLEEQNNVTSIEEYKECNEVSIVGKLAAGKGTSNFDKTRPIDIVNVRTEEIPDGYDLAFQIVGDSMEPHFKDGEIAYVKELCEFVDKKIYAVEVNHEAFIKKVYRTSEGYSLVSLNNDTDKDGKLIYPPITVSDTDDFHIIGKVL